MNSKKWVYRTIYATLGIILGLMLVNYAVDPFQQYRKATLYKPFYKKGRYINPGIAKTHSYNTVIIGTSMVQNFKPSYIDKVMGVRSVKLPLAGSSAYEQSLSLKTALNTGKVRRVLFGLDVFAFKGDSKRLSGGKGSIPFYLYDDKLYNDYKYLLNIDTVAFYRYIIRANLLGKDERYLDYDNYGYWGHKDKFSKENTIKDWESASFNRRFSMADFEFENLKKSFDENLLTYIKENSHVRFDLFFPPYSILVWIDSHEKGILEDLLKFKQYVVDVSSHEENVRVFDFQSEGSIVLDLNKYKDVSHYSPEINNYIVDSIAQERYLSDDHKNIMVEKELINLVMKNIDKYTR